MARYRTKQEMDALRDWIQKGYPIYDIDVLNHPIRILAQNCDYLYNKLQTLQSLISDQDISESPTYNCPHFAVKDGMSYKEALIAIDRKIKEMYDEITHKLQIDLEVEVRSYRVELERLPLYCTQDAVLPRGLSLADYYYDGEGKIRDLQNNVVLEGVSCSDPRSLLIVGANLAILWNRRASHFGPKSKIIDLSSNTFSSYHHKGLTSGIFKHNGDWKFFAIFNTVVGGTYSVLRYHVGNLTTLAIESSDNTIFQVPEGYYFYANATLPAVVAAYPYTTANSSNSSLKTYVILDNGSDVHLYQIFISDVSNPGLGSSAETIFSQDPDTGNNVKVLRVNTLVYSDKLLLIVTYKDLGENVHKTAFLLSTDKGQSFSTLLVEPHIFVHSAGRAVDKDLILVQEGNNYSIYELRLELG